MGENKKRTILVIDDSQENINLISKMLQESFNVTQALNGKEGIARASDFPKPDLVLLDIMMPEMDGYEVLKVLKDDPATKKIPVIFISALGDSENETKGLELGAVDYITKPLSMPVVQARIKTHLELKEFRDSLAEAADERNMELDLTLNHLKQAYMELNEANNQLRSSWIETIYRLTRAAEYKDEETGDHIKRVGLYTREVAEAMGMDKEFVETIYYSSPIHDIGKVGVPDEILLKPGNLTPEEKDIMESHTTIGAKILEGSDSAFLRMARDIALSHHERWSGKGYPNGLKGEEIPLSSRIMNIVDQYDALRSRRPFKSSFSHQKSLEIITTGDSRTSPDDFDPAVLEGFISRAAKFNEIYHTFAD